MSLTAAELRAVYTVDEGPLDKSLSGLGGKVSSGLGKVIGAAAGLFAFDKIKDGFFDVTGAASDLNETISKSNTIFGSNAAAIDQWASGAAKNLGLSRQQALASAAGFGDMFSQIGFAGDQAADMSKSVVQMAADLGSFNNLDTADVADRMSAAFRGEYDSLQALIPNINAARVEQEAMAATGKKNASELTAQEKAAAVLAIVQKDGARAMGDFAKTSDGAANAAKIATAEWNDQKAVIGQALLPALNALLAFVSGSLIPGIASGFEVVRQVFTAFVNAWKYNDGEVTSSGLPGFFERLGYIAHQAFDVVSAAASVFAGVLTGTVLPAVASTVRFFTQHETAAKALGVVVAAVGAVIVAAWVAQATVSTVNAARSVIAWFATATASTTSATIQSRSTAQIVVGWIAASAAAAANAAKVVAGWVLMGVQSLLAAAKMAAAWLIAMGPVGWVIAAVVALVALIIANWDTVVEWTKKAWEWVVGAVKAAADWIWNMFLNWTLYGLIIKHWDSIVAATQAAWDWVKNAVASAAQWIVDMFLNWTIAGRIIKHWDDIIAATQAAWDWVIGVITGAWNWITGLVTGAAQAVGNAVLGAWNWVRDLTSNAWNGVIGVVSGAWGRISGAVSGGIQDVVNWVAGLPGRALGALGNIGSMLYDAGKDLIRGFMNGIKAMAGAVADAAKDVAGGAVSGVKSFLHIGSPSKVFHQIGAWTGEGFADGIASMRPAVAAEMMRLADYRALAALTPTVGVRMPAMAGGGSVGAAAAGGGSAAAGGIGAMVNIEGDWIAAPNDDPNETARKLAVLARTGRAG